MPSFEELERIGGKFKGSVAQIKSGVIAEKHAELLGLEPELIKLSDEAIDLAGVYIKEKIVSPNYRDDALHIALATIAQVDILVSWNFKHIVNYGKIRQFNGVNMRYGYNTIQIYSPREVTNYGD